MPKNAKPKSAPAKPVIAPAAKVTRNRESVLISTTPAKLAAQIGGDTQILVSRKHLTQLLQKKATASLLADIAG